MGELQKKLKTSTGHGFTQFELTQNLLQNLYKFKLTPTAKLVLMYLSSCYNSQKADIFPKQKTIAQKTGISEASVIRAVCELHKAGLIISERKYTNRYKFTSYFLTSLGISDNKMQVENSQNEMKETCKLQPLYIEQKREQKKNKEEEILINYAKQKKAQNIKAYVNTLKTNGSAEKIIHDFKVKQNADRFAQRQIEETLKRNEEIRNFKGVKPPISSKEMRKLLGG